MNHAHHESMCRRGCTGRTHRTGMSAEPQVWVTLSDDLLNHLRKMVQSKHVPLRWLVAGLVCDTMKSESEQHRLHRVGCGGR
jgi:hypothetical protein